jgi:hypothetical protein
MPLFNVNVCRVGYSFLNLQVEANDEEEAKSKALDQSGDHFFSEKDACYHVDTVAPATSK